MQKESLNRFHYKKVNNRYRVYDNSQVVGVEHLCIADCSDEWRAKVIVYEMNNGSPYRPDITYQDYIELKNNLR